MKTKDACSRMPAGSQPRSHPQCGTQVGEPAGAPVGRYERKKGARFFRGVGKAHRCPRTPSLLSLPLCPTFSCATLAWPPSHSGDAARTACYTTGINQFVQHWRPRQGPPLAGQNHKQSTTNSTGPAGGGLLSNIQMFMCTRSGPVAHSAWTPW
jgi:hypothetical protein